MNNFLKVIIFAVAFAVAFVLFGVLLDYLDAMFTHNVYSFDVVPDLVIPGGLGLAIGAALATLNNKMSSKR